MNNPEGAAAVPLHYVCTYNEAEHLIAANSAFWVCNCSCREGRGGCRRSRLDLCLMFRGDIQTSGSGLKKITRQEAMALVEEAVRCRLVARPFRDEKGRSITEGICFCCDDCCGYFLNREEICDEGALIEKTDLEMCTLCGDCLDVCYFGARVMENGNLHIIRQNCFGCGLCAVACPEKCIEMTERSIA